MRDVAIIGVGMIKFGRYPERTVPGLPPRRRTWHSRMPAST